jgi:predicted dinucleotide-binding enzyme
MKHAPDLDFAYDRAARRRWKNVLLSILGLVFGLQIGMAAWRLQSLESTQAALKSQRQQILKKGARTDSAELSAEQLKTALAAQTMLQNLAVPWESLLTAIETARTKKILVDAIQPHSQDASVSISVSSADFAGVAEFVERLSQQAVLQDVMLVSEALPENAVGSLRAVISASWRNAK